MIEILRAKSAGFCFGVERILEMAEELLAEKNGPVYCLGELIHNPQEVERIQKMGMKFIQDPSELPKLDHGGWGRVLIRAHGVAPRVKEAIKARGYEIADGTCPLVTIPHRFARDLVTDGYRLVIMGHREHPEIQGILGEVEGAGGRADVVSGIEEIGQLSLKASDRVGLISQTTHPYPKFAELISSVLEKVLEVRAYNTICYATFERQDAIRELAPQVDVVIVVGGHQSSNTNRLVEIASEYTSCYHVEEASELMAEWFQGVRRVGISAGASTPERAIREVCHRIRTLVGES
ncbi:MAG: 4-hydroxy-3-methylbut-2-enyl diphosphate reductase [Candidatus Fraserbacteria bacterium RBG_16_55_9]|uniref:4-hydroxy-3-methylbut-2-enyl diphosphate reductase n=1 Tax=Fraserbacteria sp. (strain RBG_16_55_9) TaxID=1817864 RepID=A0A1F5UPV0_FRAXR|nr:MAG: 4-hydroxy-3-methylbut-2-enyl diphosphate reductase [Candidatus Fraserbacteria bacterium RBG_16_55_9]